MSETIGEMILPGTYIEVRAEGLIGVGGIATGNVGIVGTANRGPVNAVVVLGSYGEAREIFGAYDRWPGTPAAPAFTLTRSLEQLFRGGASTVYAVRIANLGETPMAATTWTFFTAGGMALFDIVAESPGTWAEDIAVTFETPPGEPVKLTLVYGRIKEVFEGANAGELADAIAEGSRLVRVEESAESPPAEFDEADRALVPARIRKDLAGGPDGRAATTTEVAEGLALLVDESVNIVVVGGLNATSVAGAMLAHLEQTENEGRERIGILGASTDVPADIIDNDVAAGSNPRLVLVAPGVKADDAARVGEADKQVSLTAPYAASLVAGRLATLSPHVSLTNKDVAADGLTTRYNRANQKRLLQNRVLVLQQNLGYRVLKGITTDTGAFKQISVRRIVDYAKAGVRQGSNAYIGRLNNGRVRAALKATLDGFLSSMVVDEMLTGYQLEVTATRRQEIEGVAQVTMTLQPTFSIDFVKVIMNLE